MRRFTLMRNSDLGSYRAAEGCEFWDGTVAMRWISNTPSFLCYLNEQAVTEVHGHEGNSWLEWMDEAA